MTRAKFNFIRGMGSVLELLPSGGVSRVGHGIDLNRTNADALSDDWQRVADDFRAAFDKCSGEIAVNVQSKQE